MQNLIRLPNWLGDVVMALPLIRAISDENTIFLAKGTFKPLLEKLGFSQEFITLPAKNLNYYLYFWKLRNKNFEKIIIFPNSLRADLEAVLMGVKKRYGISYPENKRFLLNYKYPTNHPNQDINRHQTQRWLDFINYFNLIKEKELSFTPFNLNQGKRNKEIILICGSENNPQKRWDIKNWRELIKNLPQEKFILCGTNNDFLICEEIAKDLNNVENLAGKTNTMEFFNYLSTAKLVIGNDTGGIHLANAAGTPTIGLFAPTNPIRTKPIFNAPLKIIQPLNCQPTGGAKMEEIKIKQILDEVKSLVL